jgi:hypothetical protein
MIKGTIPFVINELIEGNIVSSFGKYSFAITREGVIMIAETKENFAASFAFSE